MYISLGDLNNKKHTTINSQLKINKNETKEEFIKRLENYKYDKKWFLNELYKFVKATYDGIEVIEILRKDYKVQDYEKELYSMQKKLTEADKRINELEKELHYEKKRNQFITNILREYDKEKIIKEMEKKKCFY